MSPHDEGPESFEERLRAIAREVSRSIERVAQVDLDEIASAMGVDPGRANEWVDGAMGWLRTQAEGFGGDATMWGSGSGPASSGPASSGPASSGPASSEVAPHDERLRSAGPHPLDLPTDDQGLALAALDSGRWTVEPGSHTFAVHGEGPGPRDAVSLVGELRARDWIAADGEVTLVGHHALSRWLEAGRPG
ncbi:MAG TPA: hypothetical protein VG275_05490 [Solirubrobacteraceae bacterium]|jgi:hypothetical protein|nr:hypothetical protein [Solirubrobacteraceae bacterium]